MVRVCMRPGCDRPAIARLSYDPITCAVWLDDVAERLGSAQEICALHTERLTVPRGWELSDRRSDESPLFTTPTESDSGPKPRKKRRRRTSGTEAAAQTLALFDVLRQELGEVDCSKDQHDDGRTDHDAEPEPVQEPEPVPVAVPESVGRQESAPEDDDPVPDALKATSPLLARAFATTGHQRSVLTQLASTDPENDDRP